jgi:tellurite methyltransferase
VRRTIDGFHADEVGDWVAELSCRHRQHVRHRPPFTDRTWVTTEEGRDGRIRGDLDCPLCDRAELPAGLRPARTAGPFTEATLPPGLRREHEVAAGTWGVLRVLEGSVHLHLRTEPVIDRRLGAGDEQPLPPGVPHELTLLGPVRLAVDFFV